MSPIRRVVLIYPSSRRFTGLLSTHRLPGLVIAHTGLTIIAQLLERRGVDVRIYDEQVTPFSEEMVDGADLVGISIQTAWAPQGYRIAAAVRALGKPVVIGGVHATLNVDEAIEHADFVVRGEGEYTMGELCDALEAGEGLAEIAGLTWRQDGVVRHNPTRELLDTAGLDALPWPRLDLIEGFGSALRYPVNRAVYATMLTRGCDQACRYCSITRVFGRALRHRSVGSVMEELGSRYDPQRQFLFFMDDSLAVDTDFLKAVLQGLIDNRLVPRLGWHSQMRADVARDPELLKLFGATRCAFVTCGFESIDARSLRSLGKGQSPRDVEQAIARLADHGVLVNGFFMFGTDHDGPETMARTVRFAKRAGCTMAGFMPLTPFPGTPTYERLDREGRIFTRDWELYDVQHVVYRPAHMSALELYWRTLSCYPAFYAPGHVVRSAIRAPIARATPITLAVGASWPWIKNLSWSHEVLANADYLRALRRFERAGRDAVFPDLGSKRLWARDVVSGRARRRLTARLRPW